MNITIETAASFLPRIRSTFLAAVLAVGVTMVFGFGANQAHAELTAEALNGLAVIPPRDEMSTYHRRLLSG